jgi:hypothetical protein
VYFECYLNHTHQRLLDGPPLEFPEVRFEAHPREPELGRR